MRGAVAEPTGTRRARIVIVGAGFAGFSAARTLARLARGRAEIVIVNPTDYFLYVPLLPEVATGLLDPRRVTVSLPAVLPGVRMILGEADGIDIGARKVHYTDPEEGQGTVGYDRLVLAAGSVNKLLPIPGVAEHAHGFRGIPEALYLRDHVIRQIELADAANDPAERSARCTFIVVGAGYTGVEVAAHGYRRRPTRCRYRYPACPPRWSPAATTCCRYRETALGSRWTGYRTRFCTARPSNSAWCDPRSSRWRPPHPNSR